ncbi:ABC transporter substrate-binding protein [Burkholderia sp. BCC0419]|uniref:ABC transporter substrate-binding protein n=1 Tax=Burkholderia sp. BCC0419 TaxID=486878 RepID=UPI0015893A32|nr:ABC transporter substrate-binding protein [Burkholderia sp. BCC0419]
MLIERRRFVRTAVGAAAAITGAPLFAQSRTRVRVGYLHTPAVDGHIWLGQQTGSFARQGLELELVQFATGLELFQAMIGGSLDVVSAGAVLSNFPARGQGKVFLLNDIEYATAQLWVRGDAGIRSLADLRGRQIVTSTGTTAHVFLDRALRSARLDPANDVRVVNQRMTDAVTSFIAGAVPAIALWTPFDATVRQKAPGARKLIDASAFFPQAAIVDGWAARNDFYERNRDTLRRLVAAWVPVNDYIVNHPDAAAETLQKAQYKDIPLADFKEQFKASRYYSSADWHVKYVDGTATRWLQQVTDFFVKNSGIPDSLKAGQYFDPSIYREVVRA